MAPDVSGAPGDQDTLFIVTHKFVIDPMEEQAYRVRMRELQAPKRFRGKPENVPMPWAKPKRSFVLLAARDEASILSRAAPLT